MEGGEVEFDPLNIDSLKNPTLVELKKYINEFLLTSDPLPISHLESLSDRLINIDFTLTLQTCAVVSQHVFSESHLVDTNSTQIQRIPNTLPECLFSSCFFLKSKTSRFNVLRNQNRWQNNNLVLLCRRLCEADGSYIQQ